MPAPPRQTAPASYRAPFVYWGPLASHYDDQGSRSVFLRTGKSDHPLLSQFIVHLATCAWGPGV